jgi:hypothetical protein
MYDAWRRQRAAAAGETPSDPGARRVPDGQLLNPVMYDRTPQTYGTWEDLRQLLTETGGDLALVDRDGYRTWTDRTLPEGTLFEQLAARDIRVGIRDGEAVERAGMVALVGAMQQIERGEIPEGARVLVCVTGGTGLSDGRARATRRVALEPREEGDRDE